MMKTMNHKDVMALGYKEHQARTIIQLAKKYMVSQGYPYYNGRRVGVVPANAVEHIIGVSLVEEE